MRRARTARQRTSASVGAWGRGAGADADQRRAHRVRPRGVVQRQRVRRRCTTRDRAPTSSSSSSRASVVGIVAFAIAAKFDADKLRGWAWPIMWFTIAAMVAVLVLPIGSRRRSTGRGAFCSARRSSRRSSASSPSSSGCSMLIVKKGDSLRRLTKGLVPFLVVIGAARRARGARAGPVGRDAVHAADGAAAVRRRRAHRATSSRSARCVCRSRWRKIEKWRYALSRNYGVSSSRATRPEAVSYQLHAVADRGRFGRLVRAWIRRRDAAGVFVPFPYSDFVGEQRRRRVGIRRPRRRSRSPSRCTRCSDSASPARRGRRFSSSSRLG